MDQDDVLRVCALVFMLIMLGFPLLRFVYCAFRFVALCLGGLVSMGFDCCGLVWLLLLGWLVCFTVMLVVVLIWSLLITVGFACIVLYLIWF